MATFVDGYNHTHRHTGIGLHTPADVHYGLAAGKAIQRSTTLAAARARNPERFATTADPKILTLPGSTWINKPTEKTDEEPDTKLAA
jgi:putative transposase